MSLSTRKLAMHHSVRRYFQNLFIIFTATAAVTLPATIAVQAAENDELHEVETKYIFGSFTVGSSTGIEGESCSGASICFTSLRPPAPIWANGKTNRHSVFLRRLLIRSCPMS